MAYVASYTADNIADVVIDILVGIGAGLVAFTAIIALVVLANYLRGKPLMSGLKGFKLGK